MLTPLLTSCCIVSNKFWKRPKVDAHLLIQDKYLQMINTF